MELIVTDRASIEAGIVVRGRYVVISIHDPDKPRPKIPNRLGLVDILYLAFHDAEPTTHFELPSTVQLMAPDHAREIWYFAQKHRSARTRHLSTSLPASALWTTRSCAS